MPQTPCQRLLVAQCLNKQEIRKLSGIYEVLDPVRLKAAIDEKLKQLFPLYENKKKSPVTVNPYKNSPIRLLLS